MLQSTGVQIIEHDLMTEKKQIIIHLYKFPSEGTLCMLWSHLFKLYLHIEAQSLILFMALNWIQNLFISG